VNAFEKEREHFETDIREKKEMKKERKWERDSVKT